MAADRATQQPEQQQPELAPIKKKKGPLGSVTNIAEPGSAGHFVAGRGDDDDNDDDEDNEGSIGHMHDDGGSSSDSMGDELVVDDGENDIETKLTPPRKRATTPVVANTVAATPHSPASHQSTSFRPRLRSLGTVLPTGTAPMDALRSKWRKSTGKNTAPANAQSMDIDPAPASSAFFALVDEASGHYEQMVKGGASGDMPTNRSPMASEESMSERKQTHSTTTTSQRSQENEDLLRLVHALNDENRKLKEMISDMSPAAAPGASMRPVTQSTPTTLPPPPPPPPPPPAPPPARSNLSAQFILPSPVAPIQSHQMPPQPSAAHPLWHITRQDLMLDPMAHAGMTSQSTSAPASLTGSPVPQRQTAGQPMVLLPAYIHQRSESAIPPTLHMMDMAPVRQHRTSLSDSRILPPPWTLTSASSPSSMPLQLTQHLSISAPMLPTTSSALLPLDRIHNMPFALTLQVPQSTAPVHPSQPLPPQSLARTVHSLAPPQMFAVNPPNPPLALYEQPPSNHQTPSYTSIPHEGSPMTNTEQSRSHSPAGPLATVSSRRTSHERPEASQMSAQGSASSSQNDMEINIVDYSEMLAQQNPHARRSSDTSDRANSKPIRRLKRLKFFPYKVKTDDK